MDKELTKEEARVEVEAAVKAAAAAVYAVRVDGYPKKVEQLELFVELVLGSKKYLAGYLHHLEVDHDEFWWQARDENEPEYAVPNPS